MRNPRTYARTMFGLLVALFGMTSGFVFGAKWNAVNNGLTNLDVRVLAIDPISRIAIYAGGAGGVFKSINGGASWSQTGVFSLNNTIALAIDFANPNILYAAIAEPNSCFHSDRRLFKSIDGGADWNNNISPNINGCDNIHSLVLDPTNPNILYVTNYDDSLGDTWSPLVKSSDGGATWSYLLGIPYAVLVVDPVNPDTLYAGTFDFTYFGYAGLDYRNGVLKSTDGGAHWSTTGLAGTGVNVLAIDPASPSTIYAATTGTYSDPRGFRGLFKSTDGGASWLAINNGLADLIDGHLRLNALVIDSDNSNMLYIGTSSKGVFKSIDGGANWSPFNEVFPWDYIDMGKPIDGGANWSLFNEGLSNLDIRALALTPGNPNVLYAGTAGGIFKIIDDTPALFLESEYCVKAPWKLRVGNSAPDSPVRLLGTSNGQSWEISEWGKTDANGSFSAEGIFPEGTEGNYSLRVEIGGVVSNLVSFVISNCKP